MGQPGLTFVLVHGAWHGGWCWKKVVPLLQAAGHRVIALTLTGLGERAHLIDPKVGLTTHVNDVLNTLEMDDLTDIILVGHSYGGLVISGVCAACRRGRNRGCGSDSPRTHTSTQ